MQTLYFGGDIVTMEGENHTVEALLVENGKIKKTGPLSEVEKLCTTGDQKIDLQGKTLLGHV